MAIANIIAQGIGFSPGSISFIPTSGFTPSMVGVVAGPFCVVAQGMFVAGATKAHNYVAGSVRSGVFVPGAIISKACT